MISEKRRVCFALAAFFKYEEKKGTRTVLPSMMVKMAIRAAEMNHPEGLCWGSALMDFYEQCTPEEIRGLIGQYVKDYAPDLKRAAERELERRGIQP